MENGDHYSESNRDLYNMSEEMESKRLKSKVVNTDTYTARKVTNK